MAAFNFLSVIILGLMLASALALSFLAILAAGAAVKDSRKARADMMQLASSLLNEGKLRKVARDEAERAFKELTH